jgi:shikimate kinase
MATGGGTPCFQDNMNFINKTGTSIFLNIPISEIVKRLDVVQRKSRPLLAGVSDDQLVHKLEEMLKNRLAFYEQAHFIVDNSSVTARDVLKLISAKM